MVVQEVRQQIDTEKKTDVDVVKSIARRNWGGAPVISFQDATKVSLQTSNLRPRSVAKYTSISRDAPVFWRKDLIRSAPIVVDRTLLVGTPSAVALLQKNKITPTTEHSFA